MIEAYFMSILFGTIGGFVACLVYDHTLPIGKLPALKRERRKALETENIPEPPKKYPNEEDLKKFRDKYGFSQDLTFRDVKDFHQQRCSGLEIDIRIFERIVSREHCGNVSIVNYDKYGHLTGAEIHPYTANLIFVKYGENIIERLKKEKNQLESEIESINKLEKEWQNINT